MDIIINFIPAALIIIPLVFAMCVVWDLLERS